jgi:hypothetical protein
MSIWHSIAFCTLRRRGRISQPHKSHYTTSWYALLLIPLIPFILIYSHSLIFMVLFYSFWRWSTTPTTISKNHKTPNCVWLDSWCDQTLFKPQSHESLQIDVILPNKRIHRSHSHSRTTQSLSFCHINCLWD